MAQKKQTQRSLRLEFDNGLTENGKMKIKAQTFSNIRPEATDDGLLTTSIAIDALTTKDVYKTKELTTNEITEL